MKTRIIVDVDHHPATSALSRITALLDFASDEYGVRSLEYTVEEE